MLKPMIFVELRSGDGKKLSSIRSAKKQRILDFLRREIWTNAYLRVTYQPDFVNEGEYPNYVLAKKALDQFLEPALSNKFQ